MHVIFIYFGTPLYFMFDVSRRGKKGEVGMGMTTKIIGAVIGIIILFLVLADLLPEAQTAGDTLNASGVPLGALFASSGVVFLLIMAGVLFYVVKKFVPRK